MRSTWSRWCVALAMFLPLPTWTLAAEQATGGGSIADQLDAAIRHAETYYLLGMVEQGDLRAPEAGMAKLEDAEKLLKPGALPPDSGIAAIEDDLKDQIKEARGTLEGVFPLTRFLTSPLFADSGPTATYRLIDDPAVKATRDAAADLAAQAGELEKKSGQLPVVFTAVPPAQTGVNAALRPAQSGQDRVLEHAARQVFRGSPRFRVPTHAAVAKALAPAGKEAPRTALHDFRTGHITPAVSDQVAQGVRADGCWWS